ncbi:23S rRNA pseudouridine1911/1915/1917 synthase [Desulfohalotomaculum tongense]|uniref:RluA family pseudouridine synthase n=1 Tax=Desulforadius tongensis TaxID=1216062 RepID=UPI00195E54AA|nr:RluA family pseudouridine synthase [Desulforadius tongensis]MBM7855131.1 23S rRNA pseudouridine1911/1915/1917 synthase [Desulforadius tongensis]
MPEIHSFQVTKDDAGMRLDKFLAREIDDLTRSYIQKLLHENMARVNGKKVKASYKLQPGDNVELEQPDPVELSVEPENIPLDIYYEDEDIIIVNKPQGMVVHPADGNYSGTLVNALLYHCRDLSGINGVLRPGIVHRIDKDTSGLLMVAKNDAAHLDLARQLKEHSVTRRYLALVHGNIKVDSAVIDAPIGRDPRDRQKMAVTDKNSKPAVTHFTVKERFGRYSLVECRLETGRTHQIRVHMAYIKHPVVGDAKYGGQTREFKLAGQLLHAAVLGFKHPGSGEYMCFEAPLPRHFQAVLNKLTT